MKLTLYQSFAVTVLVLQARAARARVIPSNLLLGVNRHLGLRLAGIGGKVSPLGIHTAHIRLWLHGCPGLLRLVRLAELYRCPEEERKHILVQGLQHRREEIVALQLIDNERILLLIGRILD